MNDTPKYILEKQFEIWMAKPLKERLDSLFEMTELSREIIRGRIKTRNPDISEADLKVELFKAFYRSDFDPGSLDKIGKYLKLNSEMNEAGSGQTAVR